jgi:hypothetical protein
MRALISTILIAGLHVSVLAQTCGNDPTPEQLAKCIREASNQKAPLPDGKFVVPTAEVAQAIHRAVAGAVFGDKEVERERPFKAVRSGDVWVVYGCMPTNNDPSIAIVGGVAVSVIRARTGEVIWITAGQ